MRAFVLLSMLVGTATAATASTSITPDNGVYCLAYESDVQSIITSPSLESPQDIAVDGNGDIFVVDRERRELIRIDGSDHSSVVLMGPEYLEIPIGLTISQVHADLYIGDENTSTIWCLVCQTRNSNYCDNYYATPLNLTLASAVHPMGLQMDLDDHLYIADFNGHQVLKRDTNTGQITVVLNEGMMDDLAPSSPFGPHDIAIDQNTNELLVTDITNDDIWTVACGVASVTGLSCDQYTAKPTPLDLSGDSITAPSGIATDLQGTIYVTGMVNGVIDEIKGATATNLLASASTSLADPVSLAYDPRNTAKTVYVSDDHMPTSTAQGLYSLSCTDIVCVQLDSRYVANIGDNQCIDVPTGNKCNFQCADGFASPNVTTITCGASGWETSGVACVATSDPSSSGDDGAGVAVGVTLAILVILGIAVFLFIRYRQGKLVVKRTGDYAPFGSAGV